MRVPRPILTAVCAAVLAATVASYGTGALPGTLGTSGHVPMEVTRSLSATNGSCGECHNALPGGGDPLLRVFVDVARRALQPGETVAVATRTSGGRPSVPPLVDVGGFCMEATAGTFTAGGNSQVDPGGRAITHQLASASNGRHWQYSFTAPMQPGPLDLFAVANTADGDGEPFGDIWGFHGRDAFAPWSTPVRLYVLAPGVQALGESCPDGNGLWPVLGASETPAVGNAAFGLELRGATPGALVAFLRSADTGGFAPVELGPAGLPGCWLQVPDPLVTVAVASGGLWETSEGAARLGWPVPDRAALRGLVFRAQAAFVDPRAGDQGRSLPLTFSNGLRITVR